MEWVKINHQDLLADHNSGLSLSSISRKYGVSRPTIKKKLKNLGIIDFNFLRNNKEKFRSLSRPKQPRQPYINRFEYKRDCAALADRFMSKAREVHGDIFDYSNFNYSRPDGKCEIICKVHGPFWQEQSSHLKGHGCPKCGRDRATRRLCLTTSEFITKARAVHGDKYDYSLVVYVNNRMAVKIICKKHGEFTQRPMVHLRGGNCPICYTYTTEEFIKKASEVHDDKYDYSLVEYSNLLNKIWIICPVHGKFQQQSGNHINGSGCMECARERTSSVGESELCEFVCSFGHIVERHRRSIISPYELDIALPELKLAIEYNGIYWHSYGIGDIENRNYHKHKLEMCEKIGWRLIQINEDEWANKTKRAIIKSKLEYLFGRVRERIYARRCLVTAISNGEAAHFLCGNHIQGNRDAKVKLALEHDGQIIAVMTCSTNRGGWEIVRFAVKKHCAVIGGFGKLLKHFIAKYSPKSIISYADRRYSDGRVYIKCGFKLNKLCNPNYCYVKNGRIYSRQQFQRHKLADRLEQFNPHKTEAENMFANGYRRMWDCGHYKYVLDLC